ncbi:hypothetical protein mRhiFer1_010731 [Rhinolophus ferrumequinum]|uniref:non-specific serine/threonine protein kinase n=1 Tax=Rhinolophus ferrumequinum TaxID=59479 RepID=A0A7J7VE90_RHIFE|nr:serine/threonine-protein kinase MARK2-like [Rhinolophus ferrumequinum]KAF6323473.1 hypothetical protein mRhiFer1_010731 [Rhinolophus ferrumequinum]
MSHDFSDVPVDQEPYSGHYELLQTTGKGTFSKVVLGQHLLTGTKVTVKIMDQLVAFQVHRPVLREVHCMADLHHHNFVQLFHMISTTKSLFLVLELVPGGDLVDYLCAYGCMPEDNARSIFQQLVSAVQYCHDKGIAHRHPNAHSMLLDTQMNTKVKDFGLGTSFTGRQLSTFCGSPTYAAPELFLGQKYHGPAADLWSLGVLLYRTLLNTVPFKGMNWGDLQRKVLRGKYVVPSCLSLEVENFQKKLLTLNPQNRKHLKDMPHTWLNKSHEEELKPYIDPPSDVTDPWVTKEMLNLGFHWEDIKDTLSKKTYNNVLAKYCILNTKKTKVQYHTFKIKPFHPPELQSPSLSAAQKVQPECSGFQQAEQQPIDHESGQKFQESTRLSAILESSTTTSNCKVQDHHPQPSLGSKCDF